MISAETQIFDLGGKRKKQKKRWETNSRLLAELLGSLTLNH